MVRGQSVFSINVHTLTDVCRPVVVSTDERVVLCIEHLKIPPFSDPTTNRFLSSFEKDKHVPELYETQCFNNKQYI